MLLPCRIFLLWFRLLASWLFPSLHTLSYTDPRRYLQQQPYLQGGCEIFVPSFPNDTSYILRSCICNLSFPTLVASILYLLTNGFHCYAVHLLLKNQGPSSFSSNHKQECSCHLLCQQHDRVL